MQLRTFATVAVALLVGATMAAAPMSAQTITIGDKDCFGGQGGPGPLTCTTFTEPTIPSDYRSPAEQSAVNGAQQTDYYSALFIIPSSFSMTFATPGTVTGATFTYRSYGLQALTFGELTASFNGIDTDAFFYEDGSNVIATHSFAFTGADLASINTNHGLTVDIDRGGSGDGLAFDYFELVYSTSNTTVPEPSTYALFGMGLAGLAVAHRRRKA